MCILVFSEITNSQSDSAAYTQYTRYIIAIGSNIFYILSVTMYTLPDTPQQISHPCSHTKRQSQPLGLYMDHGN